MNLLRELKKELFPNKKELDKELRPTPIKEFLKLNECKYCGRTRELKVKRDHCWKCHKEVLKYRLDAWRKICSL